MNNRALLFFLLLSIILPAHAQSNPFSWYGLQLHGEAIERGAILVPVGLDEKLCNMQLDTGSGTSILYRDMVPKDYDVSREKLAIDEFSFDAKNGPYAFKLLYEDNGKRLDHECLHGGYHEIVGTLGADMIHHGILKLDLKYSKFSFSEQDMGIELNKKRLQKEGAKIYMEKVSDGEVPIVMAKIGARNKIPFILDTGSPSADLIIFKKEDWLKLVGLKKEDDAELKYKTIIWGESSVCYLSKIKKSFSVGALLMGRQLTAIYCDSGTGPKFQRGEFGAIGLAPFMDRTIVFDFIREVVYLKKSLP